MDCGSVPIPSSTVSDGSSQSSSLLMKQENHCNLTTAKSTGSNSGGRRYHWEDIRMANISPNTHGHGHPVGSANLANYPSAAGGGTVITNANGSNNSNISPVPAAAATLSSNSSGTLRFHQTNQNSNSTGSGQQIRNNTGPGTDFSMKTGNSNLHSQGPLIAEDQFLDFTNSLHYQHSPNNMNMSMMQKKKATSSVRDPLSHRIIEKRRRDRMNNCLADLARLLPQASLRKGRGRIEKTEIVELAIRHLKHLQLHKCEFGDACEYLNNSAGKSRPSDPPGDQDTLDSLNHKSFRLGYEECFSECLDYLSSKSSSILNRNVLMDLIEHLLSFRTQSFNYNNQFNKNSAHDSSEFTTSRIDELINRIKNSDPNAGEFNNGTETENHRRTKESTTPHPQQSHDESYDFAETSCCSSPMSVIDSCEGNGGHGGINGGKPPIPSIVGGSSCKSASVLSSSNGGGSRSSDEGSSSASAYSNDIHKYTKFKSTIKQRFINQETECEPNDHEHPAGESCIRTNSNNSPPPMVSIVNLAELREPEESSRNNALRNTNAMSRHNKSSSNTVGSSGQLIPGFVLCEKGLFYIPITIEKSVVEPYFKALADQNEYLESTKLFPPTPLHPITINVCFLLNGPSHANTIANSSNCSRVPVSHYQTPPTSTSSHCSSSKYINTSNISSRMSSHSENLLDIEQCRRRNLSLGEDSRSMWKHHHQNNFLSAGNPSGVGGKGTSSRKRNSESVSMSPSPSSSLGYWSSYSGGSSSIHNYSHPNQSHNPPQINLKQFSNLAAAADFAYGNGNGSNLMNSMYPGNELNLSMSNRHGHQHQHHGPLSIKSDDGAMIGIANRLSPSKKPKRI